MPESLPEDPDSLEKWKALPQNKPSKEALPPLTGGNRLLWGLVIAGIVIALIVILSRGLG
jgi:hypothetical protein